MLLVDLQIAVRSLTRHTRRNLLLGGALAAVTALLVLLGGILGGIRATMLESGTTLISGHVNVGGFYKITPDTAAPFVTGYAQVLEATRKLVPEIDYVTLRVRGSANVVSETSSIDLALAGIEIAREPGIPKVLRLVEGNLDEMAKPGALLLFEDQARRLAVKVGDPLILAAKTPSGVHNTADVHVAVIARNMGLLSSFTAFAQAATLRQLYQLKDTATGSIQLYLADPARSAQVASRLRTGLAAVGWHVLDPDPHPYVQKLRQTIPTQDWTGQRLDVTTWQDELSFMNGILAAIQGLTGLVGFVLMAIVVVGILNTLAIAVRERTREIGTLRAIGMQRRKVLWLFFLEAGLLGLAGSAAGALLGAGTAGLLNAAHIAVPESVQIVLMHQRLTLAVNWRSLVADVAFLTAVTTASSCIPSFRAARLRPVTAMHHIG